MQKNSELQQNKKLLRLKPTHWLTKRMLIVLLLKRMLHAKRQSYLMQSKKLPGLRQTELLLRKQLLIVQRLAGLLIKKYLTVLKLIDKKLLALSKKD